MNVQTDAGREHLEQVRAVIRALADFRDIEQAAIALGMPVEDVEALRASVYGRAFAEYTYGPARAWLRHAYAHELAGVGMTPIQIARVFALDKATLVEAWLAVEPPKPEPPAVPRFTGNPCRKCGSLERSSASGRCARCHYAGTYTPVAMRPSAPNNYRGAL